jgi:ribose transport system permease protein
MSDATTQPKVSAPSPIAAFLVRSARELGILLILVILAFVASRLSPNFVTVGNFVNIARLVGIYGIFSLGVGLVIVTGGIDLSIGSLTALFAIVLSIWMVEKHWSPWIALPAAIAMCAALGALHGFLITKVKLQPFIVTLCGLLIYRSLAQYIAKDETKGFGDSAGFEGLSAFLKTSPLGVPVQFWIMLTIAVILGIVLHRSVYGRYLYAVGRNEEAARYSGIETKRVIASAYVLTGLLTGIGALLLAFYTVSISPATHGTSYEMFAIAAAVLGGFSLRGGEGSIVGVVLGTVLLQVLQNLVTILGIPSSLNLAVVGVVILIGVLADRVLNRRAYA